MWFRRHARRSVCAQLLYFLTCFPLSSTDHAIRTSPVIGVITATICNLSTKVKHICGFEDPADVAALHLIGGIAGNIFTGIFAQASVAANDGVTVIDGGWLDGNWM